jgi:hypothetical protein
MAGGCLETRFENIGDGKIIGAKVHRQELSLSYQMRRGDAG